jgi:hypothetical protein
MPAAYTRSAVADKFPQPAINPDPRQRAQVWDPTSGLPVTHIFQSRYASSEEEYRAVKLPTFPKSEIRNQRSEILSGSRLDGTGGWKPLELGEIVARWKGLRL